MLGDREGEFLFPTGITVGETGLIYVSDCHNNRIQVFDKNGGFMRQWGMYGAGDGQFNGPHGIVFNPDGELIVADTMNNRLQKFEMDPYYKVSFMGVAGRSGNGCAEFRKPSGLACSKDGRLFVSDYMNHRVQVWDECYIGAWGKEGEREGEFRYPEGMAIDDNSIVYVGDTRNHRVQAFRSDGTFLHQFGTARLDDVFQEPAMSIYGLAFGNGVLYVCGEHHISVFA